jgi:uncharacterized RDD family membrane protein YckC
MTTSRVAFDTVPAEARSFNGAPAGLVSRTLANVVDLLVVGALLAAAYLGVAGLLFLRRGASFSFPVVGYPTAYTVGVAGWILYTAIGWRTNGRTYGDHLLGLRVRTIRDGPVGAPRAVIRAILCAIAPLLLVWVAFSKQQRSVQDLLVGTHVIYDWSGARPDDRPGTPPDGPAPDASSDDTVRVRVDVAPSVADEPDDRHAEPLPRVDGER